MSSLSRLGEIETLMARDQKFVFTMTSFVLTLLMYINLNALQSPVLGFAASVVYSWINGTFLGRAFFEKETAFFRLILGVLLLVLLLGFIGWLAVIIYNLDVFRFTVVLFIAAAFSSLLNRKVKGNNGA